MAGVKVAFGDDRLVLPLGNTSDRVGRLLNDISIRFRLILGKSERELKFVQLHSQVLRSVSAVLTPRSRLHLAFCTQKTASQTLLLNFICYFSFRTAIIIIWTTLLAPSSRRAMRSRSSISPRGPTNSKSTTKILQVELFFITLGSL